MVLPLPAGFVVDVVVTFWLEDALDEFITARLTDDVPALLTVDVRDVVVPLPMLPLLVLLLVPSPRLAAVLLVNTLSSFSVLCRGP